MYVRCCLFYYNDRISFTPHLGWVEKYIYLNLMEGNFDSWGGELLGQLFLNVRIIFYLELDVRHDNNDLHFSDWSIWLWWPIKFVSQKKLIFLFVSVKSSSFVLLFWWWIDLPDPVLNCFQVNYNYKTTYLVSLHKIQTYIYIQKWISIRNIYNQ